jgi:hypothetical protein
MNQSEVDRYRGLRSETRPPLREATQRLRELRKPLTRSRMATEQISTSPLRRPGTRARFRRAATLTDVGGETSPCANGPSTMRLGRYNSIATLRPPARRQIPSHESNVDVECKTSLKRQKRNVRINVPARQSMKVAG